MNCPSPLCLSRFPVSGLGLMAVLLLAGLPVTGEAKAVRNPNASTGRVLSATEVRRLLPGTTLGDTAYAEVNSLWLRQYYATFRKELFRAGVVRWDERFDCNRFASFYTGLAQACFFREAFHSSTPAKALALGPYWYNRADGRSHAVVQALTERGRIFLDPQTGEELQLQPEEKRAVFPQFI